MRYNIIKKSLEQILPKLKLSVKKNMQPGSNVVMSYSVINWLSVHEALYALNKFPFATSAVKRVFDIGVNFQTSTEMIVVDTTQYFEFIHTIDILKYKVEAVIDTIKDNDLIESENQLNIKLPPLTTLENLQNCIKKINISFTQNEIFDEQLDIKFLGVQQGSEWIMIAITGISVLGNICTSLEPIANYIKACFEIRKTVAETTRIDLESELIELKIDKQVREDIIKAKKAIDSQKLTTLCIDSARHINTKKIDNLDPDSTVRMVHAMKTLAILFNDGMEIYPTDTADEEAKLLFPVQEEFLKLTGETKALPINVENSGTN